MRENSGVSVKVTTLETLGSRRCCRNWLPMGWGFLHWLFLGRKKSKIRRKSNCKNDQTERCCKSQSRT